MLKIAREKNINIKYILGKAERLSASIHHKFDYILMTMFFCCIDKHSTFENVFKELKKHLKNNGQIIIVDYHFTNYKNLNTPILEHQFFKKSILVDNPYKFKVRLKNKNNKFLEFFDYYWKLEQYKEMFNKFSFQIDAIYKLKAKKPLFKYDENILDYFQKNAIYMLLKISNKT
jgi:SAM-dependent methyltransferase